jgi:hypothetical protein
MYIGLHVKYPLFSPNKILILKTGFQKNIQKPNFMKILPVRAELFHADGRTARQTDRHDEFNIRVLYTVVMVAYSIRHRNGEVFYNVNQTTIVFIGMPTDPNTKIHEFLHPVLYSLILMIP